MIAGPNDGAAERSTGMFAGVVRELRERRGMTQRQLAELSAVSIRAVRDIERAVVEKPRRQTVAMLADGLALTGPARRAFERASGAVVDHPAGAWTVPASLDPLIGRAAETDLILRALSGSGERFVIVSGLSGIGKTRLVMEVARVLENRRRHVLWVPFAGEEARPGLWAFGAGTRLRNVVMRLAWRSLVQGDWAATEELVRIVGGDDAIVVLDGVPDVAATSSAVTNLLVRRPNVRVLATSLTPGYHVPGARTLPLRPLSCPSPDVADVAETFDSAAVQLFAKRAGQKRPDFVLQESNAHDVARLCRLVDGIPLAIELLARHCCVLEPGEVVTGLASDGRELAVDDEVWAAIRTSWATLPLEHRQLARRLAADARTLTLAQAGRLLDLPPAPTLSFLRDLAGRGMLTTVRPDGESRVRLVSLVRRFLADKQSRRHESPLTARNPSG